MSGLPSYAAALSAFHRAAAPALRGIVEGLPIEPGSSVLDAPCGDGTYLPWLRARVGAAGRVVGADRNTAYLDVAKERVEKEGARALLVKASMDDLPAPFDFVWCAHSLYSLSDPAAVLQSLRRVIVPGGRIGLVENDSFHHWLLPWPVELELAVKRAQLDALVVKMDNWQKAYVGRNLATLLREQGFEDIHVSTVSVDHRAPLSADEKLVVRDYLEGLRKLTWAHLDAPARAAFQAFEQAFESLPDFFAAHLEIVATARRP